ncbi:hypothetical protein GCM10010873_27470 [Cypionkella aquatica]|uniref:Uncharacterized protein n=1 Tax=Cypionkella aquatica TaxID=1756042 RepID=A0AA37TXV5_9RHOB|nr:hypothetical protein GCM10010873_27470 [Cypionkella aquatica]
MIASSSVLAADFLARDISQTPAKGKRKGIRATNSLRISTLWKKKRAPQNHSTRACGDLVLHADAAPAPHKAQATPNHLAVDLHLQPTSPRHLHKAAPRARESPEPNLADARAIALARHPANATFLRARQKKLPR